MEALSTRLHQEPVYVAAFAAYGSTVVGRCQQCRIHAQQSPLTRLSADLASMRSATGKAKVAAGCLRASAA